MMYLYSWNKFSQGAKALSKELGIKRIRHIRDKFKGSKEKLVINWGATTVPPEVAKCSLINEPEHVGVCSNKLTFFRRMVAYNDPPRVVPFTTDIKEAERWIKEGDIVCARTLLAGSGGRGLELVDDYEDLPKIRARLFTKYVPKESEFRLHFFNGAWIDSQKKILPKGIIAPQDGFKIRNYDNGFIFIRDGISIPEDVYTQCDKAFKASQLTFGAVDVIYNKRKDQAYVLEINTAPGLMGSTILSYANAIRKNYNHALPSV